LPSLHKTLAFNWIENGKRHDSALISVEGRWRGVGVSGR